MMRFRRKGAVTYAGIQAGALMAGRLKAGTVKDLYVSRYLLTASIMLQPRGGRIGRTTSGIAAYIKDTHEEITIGLQIETPEAVENAAEIINTEEPDLIFLGPGDLSPNFGFSDRAQHPKVIETVTDLPK